MDTHKWQKPFLRIGHSGAGQYAPPNTLKSIRLALEMGVDMVEVDVRPCRDTLVLAHNATLPASYRAAKPVRHYTIEELRTFGAADLEPVATFAEAIELVGDRALMNVDVKSVGYEAQIIDLLTKHDALDNVLISSSEVRTLRTIRQLAPTVKTGLSYRARAPRWGLLQPIVRIVIGLQRRILPYYMLRIIDSAQADAVMLNYRLASQDVVDRVHGAGKLLFVWTVDDAPTLKKLYDMGVNGIASDRPDLLSGLG